MPYNPKSERVFTLFFLLMGLLFLLFSCTDKVEKTRQKRYEELLDKIMLNFEYETNKQFRVLKKRVTRGENNPYLSESVKEFTKIRQITLDFLAYLKRPEKIDLPTLI